MSTHARIGFEHPGGTIEHVYCHFDAYPDYVGETLYQHYNTIDKVKELVSYGNIVSLGETIKHTTFFCRDQKEDEEHNLPRIDILSKFEDYLNINADYLYLFVNGKWMINRQ